MNSNILFFHAINANSASASASERAKAILDYSNYLTELPLYGLVNEALFLCKPCNISNENRNMYAIALLKELTERADHNSLLREELQQISQSLKTTLLLQ
ncbi:MAG: hypothetical protein HQK50_17400 [Oligoflexia bacterium]|nr:hypothetical protein [Oligoflexia bacterium]MBF0367355.1 hypothetical protein [Oligoflexia bacterium]